jgi:hypothetical protein
LTLPILDLKEKRGEEDWELLLPAWYEKIQSVVRGGEGGEVAS